MVIFSKKFMFIFKLLCVFISCTAHKNFMLFGNYRLFLELCGKVLPVALHLQFVWFIITNNSLLLFKLYNQKHILVFM